VADINQQEGGMGKGKTHVERADAGADRVERFDINRLLAIADEYGADIPRDDEFATTWFAEQKGWTYERAMKALKEMEKRGLVTSRKTGRITRWRIVS
jgi:hypothetical protein